jgi:hypothetical protein
MVKRVTYNGVEMAEGWPERIIEAQTIREYVLGGIAYARVPYGGRVRRLGCGAPRLPRLPRRQGSVPCAIVRRGAVSRLRRSGNHLRL